MRLGLIIATLICCLTQGAWAQLSLPYAGSVNSSSSGFAVTQTGSGNAILGGSSGGNGIAGTASNINFSGVFGAHSGAGVGVTGASSSGFAGVYGNGPSAGVYGSSSTGSGQGVYGRNTSFGPGVQGYSDLGGPGIYATGPTSSLIRADMALPAGAYPYFAAAIWGRALNSGTYRGTGVYGDGNVGVTGQGTNKGVVGLASGQAGYAIYGEVPSPPPGGQQNFAGVFSGNVSVLGQIQSTGGKAFVIDHPLDPDNYYLVHASIESNEVKNFYDGIAELDGKGKAIVIMPNWFEALNKDYRYQLTPIGQFSALYIESEIREGRFIIAGGIPGQRVSWTVTGVRNDPYIQRHPLQVEVEKTQNEKNKYFDPGVYGYDEDRALYPKTHIEELPQEVAFPNPSIPPY